MDNVLTDTVDAIICTFFLTSLSHISVLLTNFSRKESTIILFLGSQMLNNHNIFPRKNKI